MKEKTPVHQTQQGGPISPLFEYIRFGEFKRLLGQVAETMDRQGHRSLAVLSELPGEGKTFLSAALALGFSTLMGKRVLVLNTTNQPQNKALHLETVFRAKNKSKEGHRGIDMISPYEEEGALPMESTDFALGEYIRGVRTEYDVIISDTCALSVNNKNNIDPIVISRHADASILVTSARSLDRKVAQATRERLAQWNVSLMGVIHNSGVLG